MQDVLNHLKSKRLILGSGSPRRKYFLEQLGLDFELRLKPVEEVYPDDLIAGEISDFLAKLKSEPFLSDLKEDELLITADTIVWFEGEALGKPENEEGAYGMLRRLSGRRHEVISSVAITSIEKQRVFNQVTEVWFKELTDKELHFYINEHKPYDKAGSYGIQEWIGLIGIEQIRGSYFNVMGFPVQKFYEEIIQF